MSAFIVGSTLDVSLDFLSKKGLEIPKEGSCKLTVKIHTL